jgi:hypothetical protein
MIMNEAIEQAFKQMPFTVASLVVSIGTNLVIWGYLLWYLFILQGINFLADTLLIYSIPLLGIASVIGFVLALIASWGRKEPQIRLRYITFSLSLFSLPLYYLALGWW